VLLVELVVASFKLFCSPILIGGRKLTVLGDWQQVCWKLLLTTYFASGRGRLLVLMVAASWWFGVESGWSWKGVLPWLQMQRREDGCCLGAAGRKKIMMREWILEGGG
ncbi:hypothetical protein EJD97_004524, partial [Solanum chilense]